MQFTKINDFITQQTIETIEPELVFFVDASIHKKSIIAGICHKDNNPFFSFRHTVKTLNNNIAETIAIKEALLFSMYFKCQRIKIYTDCQVALKTITDSHYNKKINPIFLEETKIIKQLVQQLEALQIQWIPRHRNKQADNITKETPNRF